MIDFITNNLGTLIRVGVTVLIGVPLLYYVKRVIRKILEQRVSKHISRLISNIFLYVSLIILAISVLNDLGFNLSALLGAAGIIGIAVGFAAQTSVSNIISGIFLLLETSVSVGDRVECAGVVGVVESIDLISIKVRKDDNSLVRIPNEYFIKKVVSNQTYFPQRRFAYKVRVPVDHNIDDVLGLINKVVEEHAEFLKKPAPRVKLFEVSQTIKDPERAVMLTNDIIVQIWAKKEERVAGQYLFAEKLKKELDRKEIKAAIIRI